MPNPQLLDLIPLKDSILATIHGGVFVTDFLQATIK